MAISLGLGDDAGERIKSKKGGRGRALRGLAKRAHHAPSHQDQIGVFPTLAAVACDLFWLRTLPQTCRSVWGCK